MKRKRVRATIEDVGEAYAAPSPDQPPLLGVENHE